jgi:hypothetical protein
LALANPWPDEAARSCVQSNNGERDDQIEEFALKRSIPSTAQTLLHLGAFDGRATRAFARALPRIHIVASDSWDDGLCESAAALESLRARCFQWRARVTAVPAQPLTLLCALREQGIVPDIVFLSTDRCRQPLRELLPAVFSAFPRAVLVGDAWQDETVQRAITRFLEVGYFDLDLLPDALWKVSFERGCSLSAAFPTCVS